MATPIRDKYYLRSLHQEIGLYDRKLAHLNNFESFASDELRDAARAKLESKRNLLVRNATQLKQDGIEYLEIDLPSSLLPKASEDHAEAIESRA